MRLFLTIKIWKEGTHFIAYTPELDVASQGRTPAGAEKRLHEAVTLFLEETKRMGTFKEIMEASGFQRRENRWVSPQITISALEVAA